MIDLTYPIRPGMFKYPGDPEIEIVETVEAGITAGGKATSGYMVHRLKNHHGTHVDAPAHKIAGGKTIDEYSLEKFINRAILVDLTTTSLLDREKREITEQDILSNLDFKIYGGIGALLFYTGFCDRMSENEGRFTSDAKTSFERQFTYFTPGAAEHIASIPNLNIVGIDSFAVDPSGSNSEVHRIFFKRDILPLETVVNLAELRKKTGDREFTLNCVPLCCKGADAAQTRAYATNV